MARRHKPMLDALQFATTRVDEPHSPGTSHRIKHVLEAIKRQSRLSLHPSNRALRAGGDVPRSKCFVRFAHQRSNGFAQIPPTLVVFSSDFADGFFSRLGNAVPCCLRLALALSTKALQHGFACRNPRSQFAPDSAHFICLGCFDGTEKPFRRVQHTFRIVGRELDLMRPPVAPLAQFGNAASFDPAQGFAEHLPPCRLHDLEQSENVPTVNRSLL